MNMKLFFPLLLCMLCVNEIFAGKKLIVVLIDGFKWDYINDSKLDLKGIPEIIKNGVRAPYVNPVYPALSYPNWYSIVTGLYPESHDIVNNIMYDSRTGAAFLGLPNQGGTDEHWWNGAEPIWVTAEKQNKYAAMYWWAGCEVKIRGVEPMICERHRYGPGTREEKIDYFERINDVIEMFKPSKSNLKSDRLSLVLMYYGAVDYTGHYSGPGTAETRRALKDIDDILYEMQKRLEKAGLKNEVNIMVVSDHGMTDVRNSTTTYINIEKFAPNIKFQVGYGAQMMLVPEDGMLEKLYKDLKDEKMIGIEVYKKEEIPESYHLKRSPLMNDIFLKANKGYYLEPLLDPKKRVGEYPGQYIGHHGYHYDDVIDMRTIFFATGPGFRKGFTSEPLSNVDLYNLMCSVLEIRPMPNNGSLERIQDILSANTEMIQSDRDAASLKSSSSEISGAAGKMEAPLCLILFYLLFVWIYEIKIIKY